MEIEEVINLKNSLNLELSQIMPSFVAGSLDNNITFKTLKNYFKGEAKYETLDRIAFSSARKWSAAKLDKVGTIIVGAPEIIRPDFILDKRILEMQKGGARVLLIGHHQDLATLSDTLNTTIPIGLVIIKDPIRKDAHSALKFFSDNDVAVKVISGDNPATVSAIASQAGVANATKYIDASTLTSDEDLENAILNYNVIQN